VLDQRREAIAGAEVAQEPTAQMSVGETTAAPKRFTPDELGGVGIAT
jgi:hypothetical protein